MPKSGSLKSAGKRQESATFLQRYFLNVVMQFFVCCTAALIIGNGPNTVSESTVSNTELSEFFAPHRVSGSELSKFLSVETKSRSSLQNSPRPSLPQNSVSSLFRNSNLETVFCRVSQIKMTSALSRSDCCSATSAVQHSENCIATSVFTSGMLQGWRLEGWGLSEGREWGVGCVVVGSAFWAPQIVFPKPLQTLRNKGLGASGLKIGAPQKRRFKSRTTDPTPHSQPSEFRTC